MNFNDSTLNEENIILHELLVQDLNGTTMGEVVMFTSQLPFLTFLTVCLELFLIKQIGPSARKLHISSFLTTFLIFVLEYITLIFPIILIFTVLSDYIASTLSAILIFTFVIIIYSVTSPNVDVYYWRLPYSKLEFLSDTMFLEMQPFITYFRSLVFIATTTSILGVDFHIYPRRFAKTETYGVSIMDLGVGLFVISNALVKKSSGKTHTQRLYKTLLESTLFLIFGIVRYYLVQRFNYQQHISEYGIHWNFFFTLAFVKLFSYLIMQISGENNLICGLIILLIHQYLLSTSLESYVLSKTERNGCINANREGIVSLCGYISLYLIGSAISNLVRPSQEGTHIKKSKLKILQMLIPLGICLFYGTYYLNSTDYKISRRLANLPYVTWVLAVSVILLSITIMIELLCVCFLPVKPHLQSKVYSLLTPSMLESINFNGLLFFILSNLLTGLVNLNLDVLNLSSTRSLVILSMYMAANCAVVFTFYIAKIRVKLSIT